MRGNSGVKIIRHAQWQYVTMKVSEPSVMHGVSKHAHPHKPQHPRHMFGSGRQLELLKDTLLVPNEELCVFLQAGNSTTCDVRGNWGEVSARHYKCQPCRSPSRRP